MKLLRTVVLCFAASCAVFAQSTNNQLEIPAGVNYKFASDQVNAAAKVLLERALAGDKDVVKQLLSDAPTCGPMLWQNLKPGAPPVLINAKVITVVVPTPVAVATEGRALTTGEARQTFWESLTSKYPGLAKAKVRKAKPNEISYYWATIPFDIEEPFFAIDTGSNVFVAHMRHDKEKTTLFWIDLVGEFSALKPQQQSDPTMKSIVDALSTEAETQTPQAMYQAGKAYLTGNGVPADVEKGRALLERAAQGGVLDAQMLIGSAYMIGKYVPQDRAKAAQYMLMAAAQGNAFAQWNVGVMYRNGAGLEKSDEKALPFLQKAADQNFSGAQYDLGVMYRDGIATAVDKSRGCALFAKAADQGHLQAINNLGWCYQQGEGVEQDLSKAMALYTKAAEAGQRNAQGNLAIMCGMSGDWERSYMWLRIAEIGGATENRTAIENVKKHMTQAQIDSAELKVAEWQKAHAQKK